MYRHKTCGSILLASKTITFVSGFNLTENGLQAVGVPEVRNFKLTEKDLYCPACEKTVGFDDMLSTCLMCGKTFPVSELFLHRETNMIVHGDCLKEFFQEENAIPLKKIIKVHN